MTYESSYMGDTNDIDHLFGDRDYYLSCGCWSGQADHTCLRGCSTCGAPDDCYCPSQSERLEAYLDEVTYPCIAKLDHYSLARPGYTTHHTEHYFENESDLICFLLDFNPDMYDCTIIHHDLTSTKL